MKLILDNLIILSKLSLTIESILIVSANDFAKSTSISNNELLEDNVEKWYWLRTTTPTLLFVAGILPFLKLTTEFSKI